MRRPARVLVLTAAIAVAVPLVGTLSASAGVSHRASGPKIEAQNVGFIHATAQHVNVSSLPQTNSGVRQAVQPALGRNGRPAGSSLPSRPSTGTKPGAAKASAVPAPKTAIASQFDGINLGTADCGCQPPDVNAAVGPNDILQTVNLEFAVYNKTGTLQFRTSLNNFLGTSDSLSDPRAVYDPTWNRWEFSLLDENTPSLWLVYSASSDPLGGWWFYHVGLPFAAGSITDYPQVGMNDVSFFYTTNNFDASSNYINSTAFSVPKARVYNGFGWGAGLAGVNYNTTPAIVGGYPTQQTNVTYMLSPDDANNVMYVYEWTNTAEAPKLTFKGSIAYNWAAPPRRVNQPGTTTTLDPLDGRIDWSVSQLNGRLWFAHTVAIGSFPGINWGYVNPGPMTITVNTAFHSATSDDFNPSITAMEDPSGHTWEVLNWAYTDSSNNVATTDVFQIHEGVSTVHLTGSPFSFNGKITSETRFGDFSSVWPEYDTVGTCAIGQSAMVANQYFASDGTWKTRIARVHPGTCG